MIKKLIALMLVLCLLVAVVPTNIFAANTSSSSPDITPKLTAGPVDGAEELPDAPPISADSFESGDGSSDNPFIIKTPEQLSYLSSYSLQGGTYEGKYFSFAGDIDMSGYSWDPIRDFEGTLYGNNFTISNLSVSNSSQITTSGGTYCVGFIAVNYGTVNDLNISNININVSYDFLLSCGSIAGDNYGKIYNCDASGNITSNSTSSNTQKIFLGGIVGFAYENSGIYTCNSSVSINGSISDSSSVGAVFAGGIVGWNLGDISVCSASGRVSATSRYAYVGGLIGELSDGLVENSYSTSNVSAVATLGNPCAGGLVGDNNGTESVIQNCYYAVGTVSAVAQANNTDAYCGGIIGNAQGFQVYYCFATGNLVSTAKVDNASGDYQTGQGYAGQIIGYCTNSGSALYCYYSSTMTIQRTLTESFTYTWTESSGCDTIEKSETRYKHSTATSETLNFGTSKADSNFKNSSFITDSLNWSLYSTLADAAHYNNVWIVKDSYPNLHTAYNYSAVVISYIGDTVIGVDYQLCDQGYKFNYTAKTVSGYTPDLTNISDTINSNKIYSVNYTRTIRNINIVCKDQDGKIIGSATQKVAEGASYSLDAPEIEGYTPRQDKISGNMGSSDIEIELVYDTNEYTVNLQFLYLEEDPTTGGITQKTLATPYTASRKYGEEIIFDAPQISGYKIITQSLNNLTITDGTIHIPATCAENIEQEIVYSKADTLWYTFVTMLGTTPLQGVSVTVDGVTKKTDKNGRAIFSYGYTTQQVSITLHKDGFSSGIYELSTKYTLKTDLGIDYFNMKINTENNPDYSVQGISCCGNDIEKDFGVINVKYDGYVPIAVKGNIPATDTIIKMQLVQEVESVKVSSGDDTIVEFEDNTKVRKILQTIGPSDPVAFETKDGVPTGVCVFNLMGTQFSYQTGKEYPLYVYMYTENGSAPVIQKLKINTIKLATNIKFDGLFNDVSVSLSNTGLSFLDGTKLSFELNDKYKVENPFSIEVQNNEIYVAYDMSDDFEYAFKTYSKETWNSYKELRDSEKRADDFMKYMAKKVDEKFNKGSWKKSNTNAAFSLDASAAAGMCFTVYGDGKTAQYSYFKLGITAKASWTSDMVILFIPITVQVSVSAEGEITITGLGYDFEHQKIIIPSTEMSLTANLAMSVGIGNRFASVGAFGRISVGTKLVIGETTYFDALILNGTAGFYAKLDLGLFKLYGEKSWKFLDKKITFAPQKSIKASASMSANSGYLGVYQGLPVYDASAYNLEGDITVTIPDWQVDNSTVLEAPGLSSGDDIYKAIDTANGRIVAISGNRKLAIYFARSDERDSANAKVLVYRVYDEVAGGWSEPRCVDDNGTGDTGFDVIEYKNKIYIVYNEANRVFNSNNYQDDNTLINDITFAQDIRIAVFDYMTNSFVSVTEITSDSNYDTLPTFGIANDILYLVWNKNTAHDNSTAFCMNDQNQIWYKSFNGYVWSESTMLLSGCYPILDMVVSELSGSPYISLIIDEDANLYTDDDTNLYISDLYGNLTYINCYGSVISQLQSTTANGTKLLLWKSDSKIMALASINSEPYVFSDPDQTIADDYVYINISDDSAALLWAVKDINSENNEEDIISQIYISYKNGYSDWTAPSVLATVPYHLMSFSITSSNGALCLLFTDTYIVTDESNTEQTLSSFSKLCYRYFEEPPEIISKSNCEVIVNKEENTVTVTVTITNNGVNTIEEIGMTLTDVIKVLVESSVGRVDNTATSVTQTTVRTPTTSGEESYKEVKNNYFMGQFVVNLLPGQSTTITAQIALTSAMFFENYEISVYVLTGPTISGSVITPSVGVSPESPSQQETLPYDLSISGEYIIVGETEYLSIRVENIGDKTANGTLKLFRIGESDSFYSVEIDQLMTHNIRYYLIKLNKDFFKATLQDFLCLVESETDNDLTNNQITILARKLEGVAGTTEDLLVEIPILSQYQQTFDKYDPLNIVLTVTTNDDLLKFAGCIDENQNPVIPNIVESGYNQTFYFRQRDLLLLENGAHEISLIYLTQAGYVEAIYTINVIDSRPIQLEGNISILIDDGNSGQIYTETCQRGSTLTIDVSSVNTDQLTYEWIVDDYVISYGRTYTVETQYLGHEIQARVTGINPYYGTLTTQYVYIEKVKRQLNAPIVISESPDNTIVVQKAFHVGDDKLQYGYSETNDSSTVNNWQYSNQLTLPKSGIYYLFVKASESDIYESVTSNSTKYSNVLFGVLSGTVTSFDASDSSITLQLISIGQTQPLYEITVNGNNTSYTFDEVIYGDYIMRVSKSKHTTRYYAIVINNSSVLQDAIIYLFGDINEDGETNALDLTDLTTVLFATDVNYIDNIACDLNADGKINLLDLSRLKRFFAGTEVSFEASATINNNYIIQDMKIRMFGDTNDDGEINSLDLTALTTALFASDVDYFDNITYDVNADGKINLLDLSRLKSYLANSAVPLGKI